MLSSSQDEKEIFFEGLDELDELALEDDGDATISFEENTTHSYSANIIPSERSSSQEASNEQVRLAFTSKTTGTGSPALSTKKTIPAHGSKRRSSTPQVPPMLSKKQSGKKSFHLQPVDAQIFRGLTFYFLPNNDIAIPRKRRIEKVQEYGAAWAREWSAAVTHIVVDGNLRLSDVRKGIGSDQLKAHHIIVNDTYPPDCVKFQVLLPAHLIKFQVAGGVLQPGLKAEEQHLLEDSRSPASKVIIHSAAPETPHVVAKHRDEHDEPSVLRSEPTSFVDAEGLGQDRIDVASERPKGDQLDRTVAEVREIADLSLDSDDESFKPSSYGCSSDSEDYRKTKVQRKKSKRPTLPLDDVQSSFSCMRKNEGKSESTNANCRTIEELEKMAHYYDRIADHWRTTAYRICITALKRQSEHITSREQAMQIPGIGERLAAKIEEIAWTNRLKRLEGTVLDTNDQLLQLFMGIYQVGLPTASRWIAQGHKSLEDLKLNGNVTPNQRIGIDHYEDFLTRIPRSEVKAHADIVRNACTKADKDVQVIVGGSYRRGAADSGDIDCIVTKENGSLDNVRGILLDAVIPQLFEEGFLKVGLATSSSSRDQGSKWHGASALPGSQIWRRIDLLCVPWDELGAALIYFTGNDIFNRSIRLLASRKQMRLNQHGLYGEVMRGEKRQRITQGKLLEGRSEERIFEILGVPWRPPEHRIC